MASGSHPVEVVGRIRGHPEGRGGQSALSVLQNGRSLRVRCDQGYRDFELDGVSMAEQENLRAFYSKYVEARVADVRAGGRCTVMMYGPTGAGKSHTMFGSSKEPGVAYLALHQIMTRRHSLAASEDNSKMGMHVTVNVLEIYNEEIYDLLASSSVSSPGPKSLRPIPGRARLEIRGRKVKNAISISGGDPVKLVQEIANVEKRRVVKSTTSNNRSSRSHCMVVLDVSDVGGKLILVDMAGSENADQAGSEAKMQTGKINQGNGALKRVVECIANGDPYIPYRDSKLTMLLQDSFEEDGSKILMILCASPDSRDAYKTLCTLEYGAKAKCIVRLPSSPPKDTATFADGMEAVLLARLRYKDECIERLRQEYEEKEMERVAKIEALAKTEQEFKLLRLRAEKWEKERTEKMVELQKKMDEMMRTKGEELKREIELEMQVSVHKLGPENGQFRLAELEKLIEEQKQEISVLRLRAERAEAELEDLQQTSKSLTEAEPAWTESSEVVDMDISNSICVSRDFTSSNGSGALGYGGEVCLSTTGTEVSCTEKREATAKEQSCGGYIKAAEVDKVNNEVEVPWGEIGLFKTGWLPIIPEETDEASEAPKPVDIGTISTKEESKDGIQSPDDILELLCPSNLEEKFSRHAQETRKVLEDDTGYMAENTRNHHIKVEVSADNSSTLHCSPASPNLDCALPERVATRKARIENIFLLCGNHREVAAKTSPHKDVFGSESKVPADDRFADKYCIEDCDRTEKAPDSPFTSPSNLGLSPFSASACSLGRTQLLSPSTQVKSKSTIEVHVKWESTKNATGKPICVLSVSNGSSLADLRTEIGLHVVSTSDFLFLILGDLGGAPVDRETEGALLVSSLPVFKENHNSRLACLRALTPAKAYGSPSKSPVSPFRPLENHIRVTSPIMSKSKTSLAYRDENVEPLSVA